MQKMIFRFAALAVLTGFAANEPDLPPPPPPTPEEWVFQKELSKAEEHPAADVTVDPATGKARAFWLENRISRCFFGPIKRAPFFRDELMDDVDYYPEEYLKRMKREGVNGLWLTIEFRDLVETSFTPRDPNAMRRYAKLRRTVEKCAAHGIGIWIFAIEPSFAPTNAMVKSHPHCFGATGWNGNRLACTATPEMRQYLEEALYDIFTHVPGLAGYINISHGERPTTCLSGVSFTRHTDAPPVAACPRCSKLKPWEVHCNTVSAMARGMRRANPKAKLISWFYEPQKTVELSDELYACAAHVPEGVTFQYNFESGSVKIQNGKPRIGGDYWLSEPGPGVPFTKVAAAARTVGTRLSAKIQAICSHENACIPYVPVPGLLYRKFRSMHELGVKDAMLCWYFGNYPGVMNRACGLLASSDFTESEDDFLRRLAEDEWGDEAVAVARLWKAFSDAYVNYPLTNFMQYYGPFHFGFVWPLYPKVELKPLSPTWKADFPPSGDTIGECLDGFTLDEAIELTDRMQVDGAEIARLRAKFAGNRERLLDLGVMETLRLQFASAKNIFGFYKARDLAVKSAARRDFPAAKASARTMRDLVSRERAITTAMIPLCEADGRLGFHSEAEAHQFYPARLRWRLGLLDRAEKDLDEIDAALAAGKPYPRTEMDLGAPTIEVAADGTVDLAPYVGSRKEILVTTFDETGCRFPTAERVDLSKGMRYRVPADAARICLRPPAVHSAPFWPEARYPRRHRLNLYSVEGRTCARLVRRVPPGRVAVAPTDGDGLQRKALERMIDAMHTLRFDYLVLEPSQHTDSLADFARARSVILVTPAEVGGIDGKARHLDISAPGRRSLGGEFARAILSDDPHLILANPPAAYAATNVLDFVRNLPTVFDETRRLADGAVARRSGDDWYLAATGGVARTLTLDLSFIGAPTRRMTSFGETRRQDLVRTGEPLVVRTAADGGFAARLTRPVTIFLAGDSTLSPRRSWKPNGSWGEALAPYLASDVRIADYAVGGRSSKSFRSHWDRELFPNVNAGDWVLLQFGPNDAVKNQPYRSTTPAEYAENLKRYVAEIRARGAKPLIVSSVTNRRYDKNGKWIPAYGLQPYVDAAGKAAAEADVPFVEMAAPTAAVVESAGFEGSKRLFCCFVNGTDNVHPTKEGARLFAEIFLRELRAQPSNPANALFADGVVSPR